MKNTSCTSFHCTLQCLPTLIPRESKVKSLLLPSFHPFMDFTPDCWVFFIIFQNLQNYETYQYFFCHVSRKNDNMEYKLNALYAACGQTNATMQCAHVRLCTMQHATLQHSFGRAFSVIAFEIYNLHALFGKRQVRQS